MIDLSNPELGETAWRRGMFDANPVCVRCGSRRSTQIHHRRMRSRGGKNDRKHCVCLCFPCHRWIHDNPKAATFDRWLIPSWEA